MGAIGEVVKRISGSDIPTLITGETGTGKELVAQAVHSLSSKRRRPFVKVNCATIPKQLLESELFGYEKGAFTGADQNKPGRLEFARGGTIFLDEIGDLPALLQSKLLRLLQEGEFFRLGGKKEIKINARVITSTNRELERMVREKKFREDLFYRLNVLRIHVPPLRERKEEIAPLLDYFLNKYSRKYNRPARNLSGKHLSFLSGYRWPGNVRELENIARKMVILDNEEAVLQEMLANNTNRKKGRADAGLDGIEELSLREIGKKAAVQAERKAIESVLRRTRWNRSLAAKILKVSYKTLLNKIKETGLEA
jgi:two-component system response regulator AtoC